MKSSKKIKIFADSTCDLSPELIEEMGIGIVPLYVNFQEAQFKDGVNLKEQDLYGLVETYGMLPKTAAPSPVDFEEAFAPYVQEGYEILYIPISSKMSGSAQNARIAAAEFVDAKIMISDSMNLSTGIGLQVCAAYDMVEQGYLIEDIVKSLEEIRLKVKTAFTVDTLEYLYKGGRCNAVQAMLSGMLQIRPIIQVEDGAMKVGAKVRGKKRKALDYMVEEAMAHEDKIAFGRIFITHTSGSEEEALELRQRLESAFPSLKVHITKAGCVIASHCGKRTIGVLFIAN